jgi:ribosomal protein S18 acetylase RimI-like enzyme
MSVPPVEDVDVVGVERLSAPQIHRLLESERCAWRDRLGWQATVTLETLVRATQWGALAGAAVRHAGEPVGILLLQAASDVSRLCSVHLPEVHAHAAPALALETMRHAPEGSRIEGQVVAFEAQPALDSAFRHLGLAVEQREFLSLEGDLPAGTRAGAWPSARLEKLRHEHLADCARLLVSAHEGSVEARINEAFRTQEDAEAYLHELVDAAGCGTFAPDASFVSRAGGLIGFCIASRTSDDTGHVPQIAVAPRAQGRGVGAALLSRTVDRLRAGGCRRVTLSVSSSNTRAASWYGRAGFDRVTTFSSYYR